MSTPHNSAKKGDIAKTVLMPGDPYRARFVAERYLEDVTCFNEVRGMLGYTGKYQGMEISVMGHGMGIPSIGIYSYELFHFYDVEQIIRIGSAGSFQDNVNLNDLIIVMASCTDSHYADQYGLPGTYAPVADYTLLEKAVEKAKEAHATFHVGNILSTDVFYGAGDTNEKWRNMGVLGVEMESAALYMNAAAAGKKALTIVTVSDLIFGEKQLSPEERQTGFTQMMEIALGTALSLENGL